MSTMTANQQPPRIAVEIVRLVLKALVEPHKTAGRESMNSETQAATVGAPATKLEAQGTGVLGE